MMTGFFMLSGFSLGYVYADKDLLKLEDIKKFYIKRMAGTLPIYYFVGLMYIFFIGAESLIQNIILFPTELLGLQAVFRSLFNITHNGGTWFISCILICYIIFPFILEMVKQMEIKDKMILLIMCSFILLYSPVVVWYIGLDSNYSNPFFRSLEFIIGVILFSSISEIKQGKITKKLLSWKFLLLESMYGIIVVSVMVSLKIQLSNYLLYSWITLPCFIMILPTLASLEFCFIRKSKRIKNFILYLSEISYAFFLAQFFLWRVMRGICSIWSIENNIMKIVLSLTVCTVISVLLHEIIEKPGKMLLNKKLIYVSKKN